MNKDFYRLHTFSNKGPNNREMKEFLRLNSIFLVQGTHKAPLSDSEVRTYFEQQRAAKFPDQEKQVLELRKLEALRRHAREQAEVKQLRQTI